jgi:outer membrane receptor protein involved in Fe transport
VKREFLNHIRKGDVREGNEWLYIDQHIDLNNKFSIQGGIRFDHFDFAYRDELTGNGIFSTRAGNVLSPKLNFTYSPSPMIKLFINNGIGFHSNDSRVVLDNTATHILPKTFGTDVGILLKPTKNLFLRTTFWHLFSEQEFVYVGDAGIVEPGGETRRIGIEFSARYQFNKWLFADADVNVTRAKSLGVEKGEDYVPLAPTLTSIGGITARTKDGLSGTIRYRMIGDRAANENNSITAEGYFLADALLNYKWKRFDFQLSLENILNTEWEEAQFDTESRLFNEQEPVSEIHYTPGRPRFLKLGVTFSF